MPRSITNENGTIRYRYDAQRMRSVKRISAEDAEYFIDGVILDHLGNVKRYEIPEGFVRPYVDGEQSGMDYFYTVRDWLGTNGTSYQPLPFPLHLQQFHSTMRGIYSSMKYKTPMEVSRARTWTTLDV